MSTKVKGLLKGLRYISQIFDEDKEGEMQIGFPTDVKHVAHIGWDGNGPSADSPSWMKEFNSTTGYQSAPLAISGGGGGGGGGDSKENPEIKWVSEDLTDSKNSRPSSSSREHSSRADNPDSPTKKESSRRHSRRSKDPSGNSMKSSSRQPPDSPASSAATGSESPAKSLPDIPKKTRRKKSKENVTAGPGGGSSSGSSRSSRSKEGGSVRSRRDVEKSQSSNLKPSNQVGEMESNCIS